MAADEGCNHQIVETFTSVGQSDPAWTENVCGMAGARDGSVQIGFGFGKYTNRNAVDAYAGISRGRERWTVRASRSLASDPDTVSPGPIHYEIVEPLQQVRVRLDGNDTQQIRFDVTFDAVVPSGSKRIWNPIIFERTDASRYAFHHYALSIAAPGFVRRAVQGGVEHPDGRSEQVRDIEPVLTFDPTDKRQQGGEFHFTMTDGSSRPMVFVPIGDTGSISEPACITGSKADTNGRWRGEPHVDGEYFADCTPPNLSPASTSSAIA